MMDRFWLLTWTTYGTWLPGDERGFVSDVREEGEKVLHNEPGTPCDAGQPALRQYVASNLKEAPVWLDLAQARRIADQFEGSYELRFHLAPPLLADRDPTTGHLRKRVYGSWMLPAFRLLAKLRFLRGKPWDPFGHTAERRSERVLIFEYEKLLDDIERELMPENKALAIELAALPFEIRGFGHIKEANLVRAKARGAELIARFRARETPPTRETWPTPSTPCSRREMPLSTAQERSASDMVLPGAGATAKVMIGWSSKSKRDSPSMRANTSRLVLSLCRYRCRTPRSNVVFSTSWPIAATPSPRDLEPRACQNFGPDGSGESIKLRRGAQLPAKMAEEDGGDVHSKY